MSRTFSNSLLMVGQVKHRRFTPIEHSLNYPLFMPCIDLDELDLLCEKVWGFGKHWWHWARFRREDYIGEGDIKHAVHNKVYDITGQRYSGKILMVCHLRYMGLYFSPVNFYYVYDQKGVWRYLLAEVSNTPWNERHYYAISADSGKEKENWTHDKAFHVSPFNPIDQTYVWNIRAPSERLFVHLACHRKNKEFEATVAMTGQEFSSRTLIKQLVRTPIMTIKVLAGIYWHAFKLWLKRAPIYDHPSNVDK